MIDTLAIATNGHFNTADEPATSFDIATHGYLVELGVSIEVSGGVSAAGTVTNLRDRKERQRLIKRDDEEIIFIIEKFMEIWQGL